MSSTIDAKSERDSSLLNLKDELLSLASLKREEVVTSDSKDHIPIQWIACAKSSSMEDSGGYEVYMIPKNDGDNSIVDNGSNADDGSRVKQVDCKTNDRSSSNSNHMKETVLLTKRSSYNLDDEDSGGCDVYMIPENDDDNGIVVVDNGSNADDGSRVKQVDCKANDKSSSNSNHMKETVLLTKRSSYNLDDNDDGDESVNSIVDNGSNTDDGSRLKQVDCKANDKSSSNSNHMKKMVLLTKRSSYKLDDGGESVRSRSTLSSISSISSLSATLINSKFKMVSARAKERVERKEQRLLEKIEKVRMAEAKVRAKNAAAAHAKAIDLQMKKDEREAIKIKIAKQKEEELAVKIAMKQKKIQDAKNTAALEEEKQQRIAEKQRKIQEAKDKAAALEREKQEAKAHAKALEIQMKKDREALKAKIAREKEEEKRKQIQETKDNQAAKIAMKQKKIQDAKDEAAEARAKALEIQKRKEREELETQKKEEEALAKAVQAAKDRAAAIERQYILKEEEARAKRELEELEAKIARERARKKKAAEERARKKKAAAERAAAKEKKIATEKAAAIKEATMTEKIAKKELEQAIARVEHARQVKMEVNEQFKTPSMKKPSKSPNKMRLKLSIKKQSKIPEISESRSEVEDVNVSSIEMDNARDVAPGNVDPEVMRQLVLQLQSLASELKQSKNQSVPKDDDEGLFSVFKWPTCLMKDLCFDDTTSDMSGCSTTFSSSDIDRSEVY